MMRRTLSLGQYTGSQLRRLCAVVGLQEVEAPTKVLNALLGASAERSLQKSPLWPSDIADDATPVEFSIAFDWHGPPVLRVLGETIANRPNARANADACLRVLASLAEQYTLSLDRFRRVQDLFLPRDPQGKFAIWYSVIFRHHGAPEFKVYLNPDARGRHEAPVIIAEALRRLGLDEAYHVITEHALQRRRLDQLSFFALDLHAQPQSRVKLYVAHHDAGPTVAQRASGAVPGVDPTEVAEFYSLIGGDTRCFPNRPIISSFAFTTANPAVPNNYSLYLPIRTVVADDEIARQRAAQLMARYSLDSLLFDRALAAVSTRAPRDGVGLIAHVSLRLGAARPGLTVYLSSEAYCTTPPRPRSSPLALGNIR